MATDETSPLLPNTAPHLDTDTQDEDETMSTLIWRTGAAFGATAVMLSAFGAHGLKKHISDPNKLANWSTAAQYQACLSPSPHLPHIPCKAAQPWASGQLLPMTTS